MRRAVRVTYELEMFNESGDVVPYSFSHSFDEELYNEDVDGIDVMMVYFKIEDLRVEYDDRLLLKSFSVEREGEWLH